MILGTQHLDLWHAAKAVWKGKYIAINAYLMEE
jgi:hypothetical protein